MKDNSFNIPAYKFAIIKFKDDYGINYTDSKEIRQKIKENRIYTLVPFEDIDGLEFDELKGLGKNNHFALICYTSWNYTYINDSSFIVQNINNILTFNLYEGERIDKKLEEKMLEHYENASEEVKKYIRCFLERYQDKTIPNVLTKKI